MINNIHIIYNMSEFQSLSLPPMSLSLSQVVLTQEQIEKLYKDLNPGFKDKEEDEDETKDARRRAFISYMKNMSAFNGRADANVEREGKRILEFLDSDLVDQLEQVDKNINFPVSRGTRMLPETIFFESRIVKTKDNSIIFKMFIPRKRDNKTFEYMRSIFNNEIFNQLKAQGLMRSMPSLIIPRILTDKIFVFNDPNGPDGFVFILGMEFITGMVSISSILTPDNYLEIYTQIRDIILALNRNGIYHNDLNHNNIQAKRGADGSIKIVLIDFGEARNVPAYDPPHGSLYFDEMFRDAAGNYMPDPGFDKMKAWADGRINSGGKQRKRRYINKSKKRTKGKKSKTSKKKNKTKNKKGKKYRK
jgi:hypothetical protein